MAEVKNAATALCRVMIELNVAELVAIWIGAERTFASFVACDEDMPFVRGLVAEIGACGPAALAATVCRISLDVPAYG